MFDARRQTSFIGAVARFLDVVYHTTVRSIRKNDGNALLGLGKAIAQSLMMIMIFWLIMGFMGGKAMAVRGDYFLYIMSGVFIFMVQIKTIAAVSGADSPNAPMMMHTPMNSLVSILAAALSTLYIQVLALFVILTGYHLAVVPIEIYKPLGAFSMVLLSWYVGLGFGFVFLALRAWFPGVISMIKMMFIRANMFASGKMFLGNNMPGWMLALFSWNPLFHIIDQTRGYMFINYSPRNSNWEYALLAGSVLLAVGFILEGYVRQQMSVGFASKH